MGVWSKPDKKASTVPIAYLFVEEERFRRKVRQGTSFPTSHRKKSGPSKQVLVVDKREDPSV